MGDRYDNPEITRETETVNLRTSKSTSIEYGVVERRNHEEDFLKYGDGYEPSPHLMICTPLLLGTLITVPTECAESLISERLLKNIFILVRIVRIYENDSDTTALVS